jgi:hypothetical protein
MMKHLHFSLTTCLFPAVLTFSAKSQAETGCDGWLRYATIVVVMDDSEVVRAAPGELIRGLPTTGCPLQRLSRMDIPPIVAIWKVCGCIPATKSVSKLLQTMMSMQLSTLWKFNLTKDDHELDHAQIFFDSAANCFILFP